MIRPTGMPQRGQLGDRVHGLLHRHLLQQRDHVHRGHRRAQQRGDALALGLDRAHLGQPGGLRGDVEEPADPAGRRRVQHHRVVHPPCRRAVRVVASLTLPVSSTSRRPGRDRGGEVDRADLAQRPAGRAQLVEHLEVFEQRLLGVDGQRAHLAAAGRRSAIRSSLYGSGSMPNSWAMPCRPSTSTSRVRRPPRGQRQGERGGDAGLAGAALAGHHVQPGRPADPVRSSVRHTASSRSAPAVQP